MQEITAVFSRYKLQGPPEKRESQHMCCERANVKCERGKELFCEL